MAKKLTANKAKEILHDKSVHGHPLTDKQRRFFGAIAGGAPIKAQKGKKVIIDGKEYNTSDPAYKDLYVNGNLGYYDKDNVLVTSNMTLPEVVISKKDKSTKEFYDSLDDSERYAFDQMTKKYGPVNIRKDKETGIFSGTTGHYNPFTNTITINPHSDSDDDTKTYLSELSHKVQFDKQGKFDVMGDWVFNDLPDYIKKSYYNIKDKYNIGDPDENFGGIINSSPYLDPSTVEYEAHSVIEPKLGDEFLDYKYDDIFGRNYNKFKSGGWLDKYEYGGQAGYTDIPFDYNSAWGGQFQDGGRLSFDEWYKTIPQEKNDTSSYNLRRAYELAPQEQLDAFVKDPNAHLVSVYENPKTGVYEFMKSKNHPTIQKELDWFNSKDPEAKQFRKDYKLDTSEEYYKYIPKNAMGGSLPGSVGFMYARTAGSAPSNGPYAKKTKASAENGMTYYQHGLDWKPKTISRDGSIIPQAQDGKFILPDPRDLQRQMVSASESTAPTSKQTTTGVSKENMASSTRDMGKMKQREREEEKARVAERKAAKDFSEGKVKTFTMPDGRTLTFDQLSGRDKLYVAGKSIEGKGRFFENEESAIDDYLNPLNWITEAAGALGTAPYEAREYDSNLPYAGAIGSALFQGALGFDPLGSALKLPGKVAQSMESGLLSNTYKLNPWAFKPNPEAYYRGIGRTGLDDAMESGVLRSNRKGSFGDDLYLSSSFDEADYYANNKLPWTITDDGTVVSDLVKGKGIDTKKYFAEIPKQNVNVTPHYINNTQFINQGSIPLDNIKLYKKDWLRGYKEVPKPTTGTLPPPQQSGFPNPLAIADAIFPRINPFSFVEDGGDLMSMSPLNLVPGYGKNLSGKNQAFRKFGNSIQDVIDRQALSPKGGSSLRIGKNQIVSEGNWAATDRPWEKYPGVFEATFDFTHPERNIGMQGFKNRSGVLITDRQGNPLPEIPLTEPGMSFNRRLPFSTRYVPIDKQKLMDNKFQLATFAPHLQSLAEKYAVGLGGAATLGAMGYPDAVETYNKYTIDPLKEQWKNFQNTDIYKKGKELDQSIGLNFLYDKKRKGGVIEDDRGQWAHPGKITKINSNQITMKGVDYPVLGVSDQGDTQMMYPEQEYTFKGKNVTEIPMAQDGRATRADSLEVYNNALAIKNYYDQLRKKGWYGQPYVEDLSSLGKSFYKEQMDKVKEESLKTYRDILSKGDSESIVFKYFKNAYPNSSYNDYRKFVAKSLNETKSGTGDKYYYKDLFPSIIDPMAPSTLVNLKILPNQQVNYKQAGSTNVTKNTPPGGSITGIYTYDPLSVKPYDMRTPQEKIEWEKKYGKRTSPVKITPFPRGHMEGDIFIEDKPKPKPEPKLKKNVSKMEPISKKFSYSPSLRMPNIPNIELSPIQDLPYRVEYTDESGKQTHTYFPSDKEGAEFIKQLNQRPMGVGYGTTGYYENPPKKKKGGWLDKYN